jgi:hypothetical protein
MKTKLAILLVVVSFGVTSLRADDALTKAANQSNAEFVRERVAQIDLNERLKQYEKVSSEFADAETELAVARNLASTEQEKQACQKMETKVKVLSDVAQDLRRQAVDLGEMMDAEAKNKALAANQAGK